MCQWIVDSCAHFEVGSGSIWDHESVCQVSVMWTEVSKCVHLSVGTCVCVWGVCVLRRYVLILAGFVHELLCVCVFVCACVCDLFHKKLEYVNVHFHICAMCMGHGCVYVFLVCDTCVLTDFLYSCIYSWRLWLTCTGVHICQTWGGHGNVCLCPWDGHPISKVQPVTPSCAACVWECVEGVRIYDIETSRWCKESFKKAPWRLKKASLEKLPKKSSPRKASLYSYPGWLYVPDTKLVGGGVSGRGG